MNDKDLSAIPLDVLKQMYDSRRKELLAIRDEIDRREKTPSVEVNFEKYITK